MKDNILPMTGLALFSIIALTFILVSASTLAGYRSVMTETRILHELLQIEEADVARNLRVIRPYITICDNKGGSWLWMTTEEGNIAIGRCIYPEEGLDNEPKEDTRL